MRQPASYIANANIIGVPLTFKWKGVREHTGPYHSAVHDRTADLTFRAKVALGAALTEWGLFRLQGHMDIDPVLHRVDAVRAWAIHPLYETAKYFVPTVNSPPAPSVASELLSLLCLLENPQYVDKPSMDNGSAQGAAVFVIRHILPKAARKAFDEWFLAVIDRLHLLFPFPMPRVKHSYEYDDEADFRAAQARVRGFPVPPEATDPAFDFRPEMCDPLTDAFLQRLDWKTNPSLRSPDEMKALGFQGEPYRWQPEYASTEPNV
jgi:hypothetical protein